MIAAIVLAAGLSKRMGRFKPLLPWEGTTIIGWVVRTLETAGLNEIVVVTGCRATEIAQTLAGSSAREAFNPDFAAGEMLSSLQAGLRSLGDDIEAALVCLGDQPQMQISTVLAVLAAAEANGCSRVVVPSYQMRAGHPILLPRSIWPAILAASGTLRDILDVKRDLVEYLVVDTPTVLADLDTPGDYENAQGIVRL